MADEKYLDAMEIEVDDSGTKETWPLRDSDALRTNQGEENSGKIMTVGLDGIVTPVEMDKTLTDNTKAAPAGVVGDLKGDLEYLTDYVSIATNNIGYLGNNGSVNPSFKHQYTDAIPVFYGCVIEYTGSTSNFWNGVWGYKGDGTAVSLEVSIGTNKRIIITDNEIKTVRAWSKEGYPLTLKVYGLPHNIETIEKN